MLVEKIWVRFFFVVVVVLLELMVYVGRVIIECYSGVVSFLRMIFIVIMSRFSCKIVIIWV